MESWAAVLYYMSTGKRNGRKPLKEPHKRREANKMKRYSVNGFERISKAAARRAFNAGEMVYFCACNMKPGAPWHPETAADNSDGGSFAAAVGRAEYYSCTSAETGRYLAYYRAEAETV